MVGEQCFHFPATTEKFDMSTTRLLFQSRMYQVDKTGISIPGLAAYTCGWRKVTELPIQFRPKETPQKGLSMAQQALSKAAGDAVLQTAIQMEDVGRDFYQAFAATTGDSKVRQLCLKLATAECKHHEVFQQMRSELARQGRTVLLGEDQSAANRQKVREAVLPDANMVRQMASQGDVRALLDLAVQMEQDSIRFYRSFIDSVPDRGVLEAIIREEQEHLRLLRVAGLGEGTSR